MDPPLKAAAAAAATRPSNSTDVGHSSVLGKRRKQRQGTVRGGGRSSGRLTKEQRLARRQARLEQQARGPSESDLLQFDELLGCVRVKVAVEQDVLMEIQTIALPHTSLQMRFIEQLLATDKFALAKHELVKTFSMMKSVQHDPHAEIAKLCLCLCNRGADFAALIGYELLNQYVDIPSGAGASKKSKTNGLPIEMLSSKVLKEAKALTRSQAHISTEIVGVGSTPPASEIDADADVHLRTALASICISAFQNHQGKEWVLARALCTGSAVNIKQICNKDERTQAEMVDVMLVNPVVYRRLIAEADSASLIANFSRGLGFVLSRASDAFGDTVALHAEAKPATEAFELVSVLQRVVDVFDPVAEKVHPAVTINKSESGASRVAASLVAGNVEHTINTLFPGECAELRLFGSLAVVGLATPASDLDLCWFTSSPTLVSPSSSRDNESNDNESNIAVYIKLKNALCADDDHFKDVEFVSHARVPVITFTHVETKIKVDLSINNETAVRNSELLKWQCEQVPQMAKLLKTVRLWARRRRLIDPKYGLNAHAWSILVAFFLQQRSGGCRLDSEPNQQPVYDTMERVFHSPASSARTRMESYVGEENVVELLINFWRFYAFEVDFARDRVKLGAGQTSWKGVRVVTKNKKKRRVRTSLVIIDPSDYQHGHSGVGEKPEEEGNGDNAEKEKDDDDERNNGANGDRDLGLQLSKSDSLLLYAEFVRTCRLLVRLRFEDAMTVALQRRGTARSSHSHHAHNISNNEKDNIKKQLVRDEATTDAAAIYTGEDTDGDALMGT